MIRPTECVTVKSLMFSGVYKNCNDDLSFSVLTLLYDLPINLLKPSSIKKPDAGPHCNINIFNTLCAYYILTKFTIKDN